MSAAEVERSLQIEEATGYDSIPTIERVYSVWEDGKRECCFPDCSYRSADALALWRHIHGLASRSPHKTADEFAKAYQSDEGQS